MSISPEDLSYGIQHKYLNDNYSPVKVLPVRANFKYNIHKVYPGTEAKDGLIYGYDSNNKLDLSGGVKKSYNRSFKYFGLNYNGAPDNFFVTPEQANEQFQKIISYFAQRGFPLQANDRIKQYEGVYTSDTGASASVISAVEFIYDETRKASDDGKCHNRKKIIAVDLWFARPYDLWPTLIKATDSTNYVSGGLYPVRLPITTNPKKFYSRKSVALYNVEEATLELKYEGSEEGELNCFFTETAGIINYNYRNYLQSYQGKYKFVKWEKPGSENSGEERLVQGSIKDFVCLAQVSDLVIAKVRIINMGDFMEGLEYGENLIEVENGLFSGLGVGVNFPASIAGNYEVNLAQFGPQLFDVTADLAYTKNLDGSPEFDGQLEGKIALVERGTYPFTQKALGAQAGGAVGILIYNNAEGSISPGGIDPSVLIPTVGMTQADGILLRDTSLVETVNVTLSTALLKNYNGFIFTQNGGDNKYFNYNVFPMPVASAAVSNMNPENSGVIRAGDNPATRLIEGWRLLNAMNYFDNPGRSGYRFQLPKELLDGAADSIWYPENSGSAPLPTSSTDAQTMLQLLAHEFTHTSNFISGGLWMVPTEAMAVAIETDYSINFGTYESIIAALMSPMICGSTRGRFAPMFTDSSLLTGIYGSTYGFFYFWTYLREQFDPNNQVLRRVNDIAGSLSTFNLYNQNLIRGFRFVTVYVNQILQQALKELFNKDLSEVWHDFNTAQVLLRNNTSIPKQYQFQFPFWIFSDGYSGNPLITEKLTFLGAPQFHNFWDYLDQNIEIQGNMASSPINNTFVGQTFINTLPKTTTNVTTFDMTNFSYTVPNDFIKIDITVHLGSWKFSLIQFTSDGTKEGKFIVDGPISTEVRPGDQSLTFSFNISNHNPSFTPNGIIRLVCSCVSITDQSHSSDLPTTGEINNYLGDWISESHITLIPTTKEDTPASMATKKAATSIEKVKFQKPTHPKNKHTS